MVLLGLEMMATQAIATREDEPLAYGIPYWNNSAYQFITSPFLKVNASGYLQDIVIKNSAITETPLTINALTGTTANLFELQVNDIEKLSITKDGVIVSSVEIGTSPLTITSTTMVANLNADLLDGNHASAFATSDHTHTSFDGIDIDGAINFDTSVDLQINDNSVFSIDSNGTTAKSKLVIDGFVVDAPQLITNGDFSDGTTGLTTLSGNTSVSNNELTFLANAQFGQSYFNVEYIDGNKYYYNEKIKSSVEKNIRFFANGTIMFQTSTTDLVNYEILSGVFTSNQTSAMGEYRIVRDNTTSNFQPAYIDYAYLFNISTLIANAQYSPLYDDTFDNLTDEQIKAQMDLWVSNGTLPNGTQNLLEVKKDDDIKFSVDGDGVITSAITTGTAPLTIASTTLVSNLNADLLDGNEASAFATSSHEHDLDDLSDVVITSPANGEILEYNGTNWVNTTKSAYAGPTDTLLGSRAAVGLIDFGTDDIYNYDELYIVLRYDNDSPVLVKTTMIIKTSDLAYGVEEPSIYIAGASSSNATLETTASAGDELNVGSISANTTILVYGRNY